MPFRISGSAFSLATWLSRRVRPSLAADAAPVKERPDSEDEGLDEETKQRALAAIARAAAAHAARGMAKGEDPPRPSPGSFGRRVTPPR